MAEIKIRSYNAVRAKMFGKKPTIIDRIILLRSYPHTHTEFQFSERFDNISFSTTMRDKGHCARFKQIEYKHPERWDTHILKVPDHKEDEAYKDCVALQGTPYDLIGLGSKATPLNIIKPHRVNQWCSEIVNGRICSCDISFSYLLLNMGLPMELMPSELAMLLDYYVAQ